MHRATILIVGAGPAGLMAAERLCIAGHDVTIVEAMPSPARKFLMAGRSGLNLTNAEPHAALIARYGDATPWLAPIIDAFPPKDVIAWAEKLGQSCFTGSSGHVFPNAIKASPLLRAWLTQLEGYGAHLLTRTRFEAWDGAQATLQTPEGPRHIHADAVVLAMGGASWSRLGSDGAWMQQFTTSDVAPFAPANCGVRVDWPEHRHAEFAGTPLKRIALALDGQIVRGDLMVGIDTIEGGPVYHLVPRIRAHLAAGRPCELTLDLRPDLDDAALYARLNRTRPAESRSNRLRKALGLDKLSRALVAEAAPDASASSLAHTVKNITLRITGLADLDRAISVAGGLRREALTDDLMVCARPGLFACGEMLDWEAPTGGYLLQACLATGYRAGEGAARWLANHLPITPKNGT